MKVSEINVLIVDDEWHAREMIRCMLEEFYPAIKEVGQAENVNEAAEIFRRTQPNLVFLDVEMGDQTGFDLLEMIKPISTQIIFVTAHDHYAIHALREAAIDYLLKPLNQLEFKQAMNRVLENREHKHKPTPQVDMEQLMQLMKSREGLDRLALPDLHGLRLVDIDTIIRCEADDNYTHVFFSDKTKSTVSRTLAFFEQELLNHGFFRVHHKHLVNLHFVTHYRKGKGGGLLEMTDRTLIEVSTRKKPDLMKVLQAGALT